MTIISLSLILSSVVLTQNKVDASSNKGRTVSKKERNVSKIVSVAKKKKGRGRGSFPGYFHRGAWCADFVYWASKKSKNANNKAFPKKRKSSVSSLQSWYKKKGKYRKNTKKFKPKKGDVAFFSSSSHVAIVTKVTGKYVYVIHGNWSNRVKHTKLKKYGYTSSQGAKIKGFARPSY